jgi:hypothetical protein
MNNMRSIKRILPLMLIVIGIIVLLFAALIIKNSNNNLFALIFNKSISQNEFSIITASSNTVSRLTTQGGRSPYFLLSGELVYINPSNTLIKVTADHNFLQEEVMLTLPGTKEIVWNHNRTHGIATLMAIGEGSRQISVIDLSKGEHEILLDNAWGSSWNPDFTRITFIRFDNDQFGLWEMDINGRRVKQLVDLVDVDMPREISWSPSSNRIVIEGAFGTGVYSYQQDAATFLTWIPLAKNVIYSPDGWMFAYRLSEDEVDSLWVANPDGEDARMVYQGIFSEVNWLPDGRLVFFTQGKEGGAACWALGPRTGSQELLADSSVVVWKPVGSIAVSPNGDALAFEAQDRQIWLLRLDGLEGDQ